MAYTTKEIVREESAFKDSTNIPDTYIDRAIAQADSYIDGRIGGVYTLPLSETPSLIQELSTKLVVYNLMSDQNLNVEVAAGVDVSSMLDGVNAILDGIKDRSVKLFDSDGAELDVSDSILPSSYPTLSATTDGTAERFFTMGQNF